LFVLDEDFCFALLVHSIQEAALKFRSREVFLVAGIVAHDAELGFGSFDGLTDRLPGGNHGHGFVKGGVAIVFLALGFKFTGEFGIVECARLCEVADGVGGALCLYQKISQFLFSICFGEAQVSIVDNNQTRAEGQDDCENNDRQDATTEGGEETFYHVPRLRGNRRLWEEILLVFRR